MTNFDAILDRRKTPSEKWNKFDGDILPLWVADMDFAVPPSVQEALQRALSHGVFGYEAPTRDLLETVSNRMEKKYGWRVPADWIVATPGVIAGFNAAACSVCSPGQGILIQPPVYPPFHRVHKNASLILQQAPMTMKAEGSLISYETDFQAIDRSIHSAGVQAGMFLLCSPHNPTGQIHSQQDLTHMAEICQKANVIICSDEIHSELLLEDIPHTPLASLSPEYENRSITLVAPSKTFNVAGLYCAFAILPNPDLLKKFKRSMEQMSMHVNSLGLVAAREAYSGSCDDWLDELRTYLKANRDFMVKFVETELPGIKTTVPKATYLAWWDCNELIRSGRIQGSAHEFFLKKARVALNDGKEFGTQGEGFVRLNFSCPRSLLEEALGRIKAALDE